MRSQALKHICNLYINMLSIFYHKYFFVFKFIIKWTWGYYKKKWCFLRLIIKCRYRICFTEVSIGKKHNSWMYSISIHIKDFSYNNIYIGFSNTESLKSFLHFTKLNVCFKIRVFSINICIVSIDTKYWNKCW